VKPVEELPDIFLVLNDKGGEKRLKLEGQLSGFPVLFYLEKSDYPVFQTELSGF
jgi:hypothetical protein